MSLQADPFPLSSVTHDLGTFGWTVVLIILWFIWRELSYLRTNMVTKDSLSLAMRDLREELREWAGERFQSKEVCEVQHERIISHVNEAIANGKATNSH